MKDNKIRGEYLQNSPFGSFVVTRRLTLFLLSDVLSLFLSVFLPLVLLVPSSVLIAVALQQRIQPILSVHFDGFSLHRSGRSLNHLLARNL